MPEFAPLRVGRGPGRLRRAVRRRRRVAGVGLAVAAAAALAAGGTEARAQRGEAPPPPRPGPSAAPVVRLVSAPVRIADAATVRLLRVGDRVDVVAAERGGPPRVVAAGARVAGVPDRDEEGTDGGALVVLSVPRDTARQLVGVGAVTPLAVTLC